MYLYSLDRYSRVCQSLSIYRGMASHASLAWDAEQDTWRYLLRIDNHATDWASVAVVSPVQTPASAVRAALATVRGCLFDGPCMLFVSPHRTTGRLWQTRFDSCIVSTSATVEYSALRRAVVRVGATISHCGNVGITSAAATDAPNARGFFAEPMLLGNATGGRPAPLCDTLSLADYASLVRFERGAKERIEAIVVARSAVLFGPRRVEAGPSAPIASHPGLAALLSGGLQWPFCDFGPGALFVQCPEVERTITRGPVTAAGASLRGCVAHALPGLPTVLRTGASVEDAVLHPGVSVAAAATVRRAVLLSCSGADRAATVAESVLAVGSVAEAAEVSHSLVGPHVALHHSSLLIAALWPEGRGNVAYGANVGSNHTGKLADQEAVPGEGVFFGLSTVVKFPLHLAGAPYTLLAAGVATLPQRVGLPFSLIAPPGAGAALVPGLSLAINELTPGWMLADNAYAVHRSELKHASRHAAFARTVAAALKAASEEGDGDDPVAAGYAASGAAALPPFDAAILSRPDIADLCFAGRAALLAAKPPKAELRPGGGEGSGGAGQAPPPSAAAASTGQSAAASASNTAPAPVAAPAAAAKAAAPSKTSGKKPAARAASPPPAPPPAPPAAAAAAATPPKLPPLSVYTDAEIPALGKSFCTERSRQSGIRAYTRALRMYVLGAVAKALATGSPLAPHAAAMGATEGVLPAAVAAAAPGAALASVLDRAAAASLLEEWAALLTEEAKAVAESKARDSGRGRRIIPDYDASHPEAAGGDSVIATLARRAEDAARVAAEARTASQNETAAGARRK